MARRPPEFVNPYADFEHAARTGRGQAGGRPGAPPAQTAWSALAAGKTLGKRVTAFLDVGAQGLFTAFDILTVIGEDRYAMPLVLTLAPLKLVFGAVPLVNATGEQDNGEIPLTTVAGIAPAFVIVEWGIGGVSNKVEADIANGLCLNLTASWVRVRGKFDPALTGGGAASVGNYVFAANLGPGYAKSPNAQRTFPGLLSGAGALAAGATSTVFATPRYAKRVTLVGVGVAGVFTGNIQFSPSINAFTPIADFLFSTTVKESVAVPNGGYWYRIVNNSIVVATTAAVFDLAV